MNIEIEIKKGDNCLLFKSFLGKLYIKSCNKFDGVRLKFINYAVEYELSGIYNITGLRSTEINELVKRIINAYLEVTEWNTLLK